MNCIIVDDEPLAREAVELLIKENGQLTLKGSFNSAIPAADFMRLTQVDLVFLDVQMPYVSGIDFARSISPQTLVIFTTAYTEYALDSYEVEAIDYLVKPIEEDRFQKAVNKAIAYHSLLAAEKKEDIETIEGDSIFVKSERRFYKVRLADILFIEGLKDYAIIRLHEDRIITKINLKNLHEKLPKQTFIRVSKSYIVNTKHIDSYDNNEIYIKSHIVSIGNAYRDNFLDNFVKQQNR